MAIEAVESVQAKAIKKFRNTFETITTAANLILNQEEKFSNQNIKDLNDVVSKLQACKNGAGRHVTAIHQHQASADDAHKDQWLELEQTLTKLEMDINVFMSNTKQIVDEHCNSRKNTIAAKLGKLEVTPFAGGGQPYKIWQQHFRTLTSS